MYVKHQLGNLGADIFDIPLPVPYGANVSDADLQAALNYNPFKPVSAATLPSYQWWGAIYSWLQDNQGVVWLGAGLAVLLLVLKKKRY